MTLNLRLRNESDFNFCDMFFSTAGESCFMATNARVEFRALSFHVSDESEANSLEKEICNELQNTHIESYYFEIED